MIIDSGGTDDALPWALSAECVIVNRDLDGGSRRESGQGVGQGSSDRDGRGADGRRRARGRFAGVRAVSSASAQTAIAVMTVAITSTVPCLRSLRNRKRFEASLTRDLSTGRGRICVLFTDSSSDHHRVITTSHTLIA